MKPQIALIGVGGYARVHLRHLLDFHASGELAFAAVVALPSDSAPEVLQPLRAIGCRIYESLAELISNLSAHPLDLAIVPTPIHLHADMSIALLQAGVHVLVEKPLTASLADADRIAAVSAASGRRVAVGFQYLHAPEVRGLHQRLHHGAIGHIKGIAIHGAWPRSHTYYQRNDWAGRLHVNGSPVLDSPINNAMSHFVMLALYLGSPPGQPPPTPSRVSAELYRIQSIESFDTAIVRTQLPEGPWVEICCTHSSERIAAPRLRIVGENGHGEWVQDQYAALHSASNLSWRQDAQPEAHTRQCMLRDVLASLQDPSAFICQPSFAATHVRLVEALHRHAPINDVDHALTRLRTENGATFTYLPGLDELLETAARTGRHLHEIGAAWARPPVRFSADGGSAS